jgi:hypothetical protein
MTKAEKEEEIINYGLINYINKAVYILYQIIIRSLYDVLYII